MASLFSSLALFLFFHFASLRVLATNDVIEDGYTVTTVIDGHKLDINPRAVILRPGSSDLLVLDSTKSAFYAVPFPFSKDSVKRFSGTGEPGYVDGEPGSVQFSHPRSFAIDLKGNVYVADRENNVIRKITDTGVTTTIAGVNGTNGHKDGPGQTATFSPDFELVFAEEICALLVSDHGNQLVRRIDLKAEDCRRGSGSGSGSGVAAVSIWSVAVGAALLVGFAVGLALRPYILPHGGIRICRYSETWKLCLINLEKLVQIPCFAIRSAVVSSSLVCSLLGRLFCLSLSHLSLLLRVDYLLPEVSQKEHVSLLDSDIVGSSTCSRSSSSELMKSQKYANQLKDLMTFDESLELSNLASTKMFEQKEEYQGGRDGLLSDCYGNGRIDNMMDTNITHFAEVAKESTLVDGTSLGSSGLVKRRLNN